jgi:hypothetical protein
MRCLTFPSSCAHERCTSVPRCRCTYACAFRAISVIVCVFLLDEVARQGAPDFAERCRRHGGTCMSHLMALFPYFFHSTVLLRDRCL